MIAVVYVPFGWQNDPVASTPLDAAELETFGAHIYGQIPAGPAGPTGPTGPAGPGTVYVQATAPVNPPVDSIWFESADGGLTITAMHVAVAA